jgi:outer membrane protein
MSSAKVLFFSFLMCVATGLTVYFILTSQNKKIAVVDAVKLFDQFNMKKELENKAKTKLQAISRQGDSLSNQLQLAKASQNEEEIKKMTYACNYIKATLEEQYKQTNHDINEQVWKRLNPQLDAYGKAKGLHLIVGANGMGSVLYNDAYYDLTDDVVKFVNKKYEEGN